MLTDASGPGGSRERNEQSSKGEELLHVSVLLLLRLAGHLFDGMAEKLCDEKVAIVAGGGAKVRVLRFEISTAGGPLQLSPGTLISKHLLTLILRDVMFKDVSLDLPGCQSLEVLKLHECVIDIRNVFPKSLQHLQIRNSNFFPHDTRSLISAQGLVTLELADCFGWTPLLKSLSSLVSAFINIGYGCLDSCDNSFRGDCGHESCVQCYGMDDDSVLLQGLSGAAHLELTTYRSMIFRKEIKSHPMFSELKTLLHSHWCVTANFSGLVYFLQHSPILERVRLELGTFSQSFLDKTREIYKPKEQFLVSKHLKAVEINHLKGDERIYQILNVLAYHGVPLELISIKEKDYFAGYCFERK